MDFTFGFSDAFWVSFGLILAVSFFIFTYIRIGFIHRMFPEFTESEVSQAMRTVRDWLFFICLYLLLFYINFFLVRIVLIASRNIGTALHFPGLVSFGNNNTAAMWIFALLAIADLALYPAIRFWKRRRNLLVAQNDPFLKVGSIGSGDEDKKATMQTFEKQNAEIPDMLRDMKGGENQDGKK
jgi:hypothetical protein